MCLFIATWYIVRLNHCPSQNNFAFKSENYTSLFNNLCGCFFSFFSSFFMWFLFHYFHFAHSFICIWILFFYTFFSLFCHNFCLWILLQNSYCYYYFMCVIYAVTINFVSIWRFTNKQFFLLYFKIFFSLIFTLLFRTEPPTLVDQNIYDYMIYCIFLALLFHSFLKRILKK